MSVILEAKEIQKNFYHPLKINILKNINLIVNRGETVAIMGRSGEGKSTLLQILGTLDDPCSGSLTIDGTLLTSFNKSHLRNKKLGFIFQSFHLLEDYTAIENILMPAKIARLSTKPGSEIYERACYLLNEMHMQSRSHFNTKLLSGGEKQRIAIARALCNDPDIIFADEPSGNLDRQNAHHIHDLLLNLAQKHNKTLIVVTHDHELSKLCQKTYHITQGELELNRGIYSS